MCGQQILHTAENLIFGTEINFLRRGEMDVIGVPNKTKTP